MATITVTDNVAARRFEGHTDDGALAGFADYEVGDGVIVFPHTKVDPAFEGMGVGSTIVREALDAVRARGGLKVEPICPFVDVWIQRHPEYQDLLADEG